MILRLKQSRLGRLLTSFDHRDPVQDSLRFWRERILRVILAGGWTLSFLALAPAALLAFREELWLLLGVDIAGLAASGCLLLWPRIGFVRQALAVLGILYLVGIFIILEVGFLSGGPAWLFAFAVFSGILLGLRASLTATALNAISLIGLAWFWGLPEVLSTTRFITAGVNFVVLNAAAAIGVAVLVNGLQAMNRRTLQTAAALESERVELLRTREELRQSEQKYRLLAENISDVIWTMDFDLNFTYVSPAVYQQQGWTPQEYRSHRLEDVLTPRSIQKVMEEFQSRTAAGGDPNSLAAPSTLELEVKRKDGTTLWAEITASFLLGPDNAPAGILGVTRDITERRRAQKEKEALLERLSRARKMEAIGTLAGGVAHDLNNVLSGVVSYPDLLLLDLPRESPLRRPIEVIQESGKKAAAIVQDLLTLARRGVAVSEVVNLNSLVSDYLASPELARLRSFHPLVELEAHLDPALLNILGSPVHLSKSIMNLVSNAAEAMPDGGRLRIATENRCLEATLQGYHEIPPGDYAQLQVADSGTGISAEDLQRIFEPFYTKKKMGRSGTGLGMAVVWGTVKDHGGFIDIRSAEGQGTCVALYFPITRQELGPARACSTVAALRGKGERVLVVDDVPEQREIATRIIALLGYAVTSVASGEEALGFLKEHAVDLVVLDMIMSPGIDGLETYRRLLAYRPRQKAVITSGFAETDRVRRAQRLGAGAYIKKPYTIEALGAAIQSELAKSD
ncbi:MAG: response regulator [Desulfobacterales bacterium]|nr:response regulator [Desulfobacterales bacterium]